MDDSQYFDSGIEKTIGLLTAFSSLDKKGATAESVFRTVLPYIDTQLQRNLGIVLKAITINRLLQSYTRISDENKQLKNDRRKMLNELREEFDPHHRQMLDLFIKLTEIKEIMETVSWTG